MAQGRRIRMPVPTSGRGVSVDETGGNAVQREPAAHGGALVSCQVISAVIISGSPVIMLLLLLLRGRWLGVRIGTHPHSTSRRIKLSHR